MPISITNINIQLVAKHICANIIIICLSIQMIFLSPFQQMVYYVHGDDVSHIRLCGERSPHQKYKLKLLLLLAKAYASAHVCASVCCVEKLEIKKKLGSSQNITPKSVTRRRFSSHISSFISYYFGHMFCHQFRRCSQSHALINFPTKTDRIPLFTSFRRAPIESIDEINKIVTMQSIWLSARLEMQLLLLT